jgi:hypothetical protein
MKKEHIKIPDTMKSLELTDLGYLKPWFVKGDDFRVVDGGKAYKSVTKQNCWICGQAFEESEYALVGDALSAAVRLFKEPPCHRECAEYAAQVCPFMLYPNAKRRKAGLSEDESLDGVNQELEVKIAPDNPGEYYIVVVKDFTYYPGKQVMRYRKGDVIDIGYWIGGVRQQSIPEPILPAEKIPPEMRKLF